MALGNWATLTVDHQGNSADDHFESGPYRAEIYKNWLYVYVKGVKTPFTVNAGKLSLGEMEVVAQTDQAGRFFVAISQGLEGEAKFHALYGVATYGYDGDEWAGVRHSDIEAFLRWAQNQGSDWPQSSLPHFSKVSDFNQGDAFFARAIAG